MPKTKDSINWNRIKLGTHPDTFYAKKYGVTPIAVHAARTKLGIPAYQATPEEISKWGGVKQTVNWDRVQLGTQSDSYFAQKYGVSTFTVHAQRVKRGIAAFQCNHCDRVPSTLKKNKVNWNRLRLGSRPDGYYAKKYDISVVAVQAARAKRGILACPRSYGSSCQYNLSTDWDKVTLGTKPDAYFARKLGVSTVAVYHQRKKRNIPVFVCSHCGR